MRDGFNSANVTGLLRLDCDYKCFLPLTPYDTNCDANKLGTGFLLRVGNQTFILTAHHVISNAVRVTCTSTQLPDGELRPLQVVGYNPHLDIAVLRGPPEVMAIPPLEPCRSSDLEVKCPVTCCGFAGGTLRVHVTSGTISGRHSWPHNRIQIDCVINSGNSGGCCLVDHQVVGVVTSGMDDMQATNFVCPIDECLTAVARILSRRQEPVPIVDHGYHVSAIFRAVSREACDDHPTGGALCVATSDCGLQTGDVVLAVADAKGTMHPVNAFMRVRVRSVWSGDDIDFRTLLDTLWKTYGATTTWRMRVRRNQKDVLVDVTVGPSTIRSRTLYPDCEDIEYVSVGGLIVQMLSRTHNFKREKEEEKDEDYIRDPRLKLPDKELNSYPIVTHVCPGCPWSGRVPLVGKAVRLLRGKDGDEWKSHDVTTLDDLLYPATIVELDTGDRVGCTTQELDAYEASVTDPNLTRGKHTARLGMTKTMT